MDLNPHGKSKSHRSKLGEKGFDFNYFTSTYTTKAGAVYYFCYEYGYLPLPNDFYALVKKQEKSNVPSVEETRAYIQRYEDMPEPDEETLQAMEEAKKEIRRILKMDIDGSGSE